MNVSDITICVVTFERPKSLDRLLESIRRYYPAVRIVVADNGRERPATEICYAYDAEHHVRPYHCGMNACRNYLYSIVCTPLLFQTDDDMEFTADTNLGYMIDMLERANADVLSCEHLSDTGKHVRYFGMLNKRGDVLERTAFAGKYVTQDVCETDLATAIFLARTDRVRLVPWDEELRWASVLEWYWRAKGTLRVCYATAVRLVHHHDRDEYYAQLLPNDRTYVRLSNQKMGVNRRVRVKIPPELDHPWSP